MAIDRLNYLLPKESAKASVVHSTFDMGWLLVEVFSTSRIDKTRLFRSTSEAVKKRHIVYRGMFLLNMQKFRVPAQESLLQKNKKRKIGWFCWFF
jgi:hypothetical protein